ncbi:hypothetical protein V8C86DRAFT_2614179 [Haematococcus lacustris]
MSRVSSATSNGSGFFKMSSSAFMKLAKTSRDFPTGAEDRPRDPAEPRLVANPAPLAVAGALSFLGGARPASKSSSSSIRARMGLDGLDPASPAEGVALRPVGCMPDPVLPAPRPAPLPAAVARVRERGGSSSLSLVLRAGFLLGTSLLEAALAISFLTSPLALGRSSSSSAAGRLDAAGVDRLNEGSRTPERVVASELPTVVAAGFARPPSEGAFDNEDKLIVYSTNCCIS